MKYVTDLEAVLRRIRTDNQQHREKLDGLISRAVSAIGSGNYGDVTTILTELTNVRGPGEKDGFEPVETGDTDGTAGTPVAEGASGTE